MRWPCGTKAAESNATLAELEKAAKRWKVGAWATSRPRMQHPGIVEASEVWEGPRWLDCLISAAAGAGVVGAGWMLKATRRRG